MQLLINQKKGSYRQQIGFKEVRDEVLILPRGNYRTIIETSSINFELKSDAEQDAIIENYQSFLNSLGWSLQIIIRTREIDLDAYLSEIDMRAEKEEVAIYKKQLISYAAFIRGLVSVNHILSRSFYVVIPLNMPMKADFDLAKEQLALRTEIIVKGLQRLGMNVRVLSGLEILNLYYTFYNPQQAKIQPLTSAALKTAHMAWIKADK